MSVKRIPVRSSFFVQKGSEDYGQFVGLRFNAAQFKVTDSGSYLDLALVAGGNGGVSLSEDLGNTAELPQVIGLKGKPLSGNQTIPGQTWVLNSGGTAYVPGQTVPKGWYDVSHYGIIADATMGSIGTGTDRRAALQALIDAVPAGSILFFPASTFAYRIGLGANASDGLEGNYRQLILAKRIQMIGCGYYGSGGSVIQFDAGGGVRLFGSYGGAPGAYAINSAVGSIVENLATWTSKYFVGGLAPPLWQPDTAYAVGAKVRIPGQNWGYLEAVKAGTSVSGAGNYPNLPSTPDIFTAPFEAGKTYYFSECVRAPEGYDTSGDPATPVYWEATTYPNAVAGAQTPNWNSALNPDDTITSGGVTFITRNAQSSWIVDNTVLWILRAHSCFLARCRAKFSDIWVDNSFGPGIWIRGDESGQPGSNANGWLAINIRSVQCGIGFMVHGNDANAGNGINIDVESAGYINPSVDPSNPGNGGVGIYDSSGLGNTWTGCQVANDPTLGGGHSYCVDGGSTRSTLVNCYSEGYGEGNNFVRSHIPNPFTLVLGGDHGALFTDLSHLASDTRLYATNAERRTNCGLLFASGDQLGMRNFVAMTPVNASNNIYTYLGASTAYMSSAIRFAYETDAQLLGLDHLPSSTGGWPDGWWGLALNQDSSKTSIAITGYGAEYPDETSVGRALAWMPQGFLLGPKSTNPQRVDVGSAPPITAEGYFKIGSIRFNTTVASGQPEGWRCTASGVPGTWSAMANHP